MTHRPTWILLAALLAGCSVAEQTSFTARSKPGSAAKADGGAAGADDAQDDDADPADPARPVETTPGSSAGSPDAGPAPAGGDAAVVVPPPALTECQTPSVDRLSSWLASGEGATVPATGSILAMQNGKYVGKVEFVGSEWHVVPVWIANKFDNGQVDLRKAKSFTLTYSATADLYVQLRRAEPFWSGGDKYLTKIPSTGGQVQTRTFTFDAQTFTTLPELGAPPYAFADGLADVRGFVFVGRTANSIVFHGLRIDGYVPVCP